MATDPSPAMAIVASKNFRCEALALSIAAQTRQIVVSLDRSDIDFLNRCLRVLVEWDMNLDSVLQLIRDITTRNPHATVVVFGSSESARDIAKLAEAGACGYVPEDAHFEEMVAIVQSAAKGEFICPPRINHKLFRQLAALAEKRDLCVLQEAGLTTRERQVVNLLGHSLSKKQIADRLCVSACTIKSHVHRLRQKLGNNGPFVENQRSLGLQVYSSGSEPGM